MKLNITGDDLLDCPRCSNSYGVHLTSVSVSARREDDVPTEIHVDAVLATIELGGNTPAGACVGEGRRQRIAVNGSCEYCGGDFSIVFTQHKGSTYVEVVDLRG